MTSIRKFKVTVTQTTEVEVSIDTDSFDAQAMKEFRKSFYDFATYEDHAEHIAQYVARFGKRSFIEGYADVKYDGKYINFSSDGLTDLYDIDIHVGDEDVETECEEIKPG